MRSTVTRPSCLPAAFDEIVAANKHRIYSYVCRSIGDRDEAEDITQDVFVKMYVALPTFRSEASVTTWLYRIAGNLCIDRHRKRTRRALAFGGEMVSLDSALTSPSNEASPLEIRARSSAEPDHVLARQEQEALLQNALESLPQKMRSALILHDLEELSYEEIAEVEQCALGTVKSRIFNARAKLRAALAPAFSTRSESN